jgi:imidazolonepropionase-like amidohydrolase
MRFAICLALAASLSAAENSFLLRNATIHTVSGPNIDNGSVLVLDGKIAEVGAKIVSKSKVKVIDAKGLHVYPGLIDAGSLVGISEIGSVRETSDYGEIGEFNPQLRTAVAVNPESEHIPVTRANGITSALVLPAGATGGGLRGAGGAQTFISGQASLMHLNGWTWEEMLVERSAAMQMRWPVIATASFNPQRMQASRTTYAESLRNFEEQMRKIRAFFEEARRYQTAKTGGASDFKTDLKLEAMIPVLEGKLPLMIQATREREIKQAMEFAQKEGVKLILAGVRRPGTMLEEIAKKNIPVILGSPFVTPMEEDDGYDEPFTLAARLNKAGVKFCFASFDEQFARNLPYEAAQSVAFGLPYEQGLKAITLNAAEILGVGDRLGSIEKGKVADLIVTDGDPLEVRTQVKMEFIAGQGVNLESKHTRLYEKYMARP